MNSADSPAKALFLGEILDQQLFPFPKIEKQEAETLSIIVDSVSKFMQSHAADFRKYDEEGKYPDSFVEELKNLGLFGLIIPEEFGGLGLSNSGYSRVLQETSRLDPSTSLTIGAHSSIGMKALLLFGNSEQKAKYLPKLSTGEMIAAFCLTEPGSGSDAASIKTTAVKNSDGSFKLNGEKIWITNGGIAGFYTVFARTDSTAGKISAFIVESAWPGVSHGHKEDKMGIRASNTTTVNFTDVVVPSEALLGEEGAGFKIAMAVLNNGRTGLGGGCVGGMKQLIELAVKQATERKQFGQPIAEFGLIQEKIALMTTLCFATESVVSMVGSFIDRGHEDFSVEAAISKIFATESLWKVAHEALQIAGGNGFMKDYPYERMVRDSRINLIFEGTNEVLRLYIALSGMKDAGDSLKEVARSLTGIFNDPIKGFGILSRYATKKAREFVSVPHRHSFSDLPEPLREIADQYAVGAVRLSQAVERLLKRHGKGIVGQQLASKRVADVVINLFVGICMLSRVSEIIKEKGEAGAQSELQILRIFSHLTRNIATENLRGLEKNQDGDIVGLAKAVVAEQKYRWDSI